jgi:acyl carrier protein
VKTQTLREVVITALGEVAPEMDPASLDLGAPIADQLEIDSMDYLDFMVALAERTGVEVPERDYAELASVDDCVRYLEARLQAETDSRPPAAEPAGNRDERTT